MSSKAINIIGKALGEGDGILRLKPAWVPRSFCIPGKRIKLHPDDYYAFGAHRGGIDERWLASTTKAENGPDTTPDEGLSYVYVANGEYSETVLLRDAIDLMGKEILGAEIIEKHGGWTMYSKFFDNLEPLPHHVHHTDEKASLVGQKGKPEAYYFPPQMNNKRGYFPHTFFGLNPEVTKEQIKDCLRNWKAGDNHILELSRAYKLRPGTGWYTPPGLLHAPGSFCTYEPQRASDVFAMFQSIVWDSYTPWDLLVKDVPEEYKNDLDFIIDLLDWELNVDPLLHEKIYSPPKYVDDPQETTKEGYVEKWIAYKSDAFSAKELTVLPGEAVTIHDDGPYGTIAVQGFGTIGNHPVRTPAIIRFGEMTEDEFFVTNDRARAGVRIVNESSTDPLVFLKHIGPL
ncbi:MAG: hypothetical protein EA383_10605 [Spirochaetaceae bacterium]|nr:MAG: hypothetical protein EA383_10605 [Spirochaetaceae bacterium]